MEMGIGRQESEERKKITRETGNRRPVINLFVAKRNVKVESGNK